MIRYDKAPRRRAPEAGAGRPAYIRRVRDSLRP